ncbi:MAG: DUF4234 domain-containing protein [Candidatus Saccharimonadales bacterium]|jgi:uncharacterized membrane protein|nr:DUF4234 domain-containing protein [Candidatus Saccharibacteria bacterium]
MKQRSIGKMFLLTVVTLGIYRLYWFAKTRAEMMNLNKDIKIPHIIWLVAPVLIVVAAVAMFISSGAATASEKVGGDAMTGLQIGSIIAFYVSILAVPVLMAIWLWKYSKGVEVVTGEKMSFAIALLILLAVPDGIDILIVQDAFNKIATKSNAGPSPVWQKP